MAEETITASMTEATEPRTTAKAVDLKKQRSPRRQKTAVDERVAVEASNPAKPKGRGKRGERVTREAGIAGLATRKAASTNATRKATPPEQMASSAPAFDLDEMADLLQVEEENRRLRKALAEKLRAENADLRKRLGLN